LLESIQADDKENTLVKPISFGTQLKIVEVKPERGELLNVITLNSI
jgi:hypothetical protein